MCVGINPWARAIYPLVLGIILLGLFFISQKNKKLEKIKSPSIIISIILLLVAGLLYLIDTTFKCV